MFSFLTDLEINVIVAVVSGVVCLSPLGTKITDFFKGIPAELRTALSNVEKDALSKVKVAKATAIASVTGAKVAAPAAAPAPAPAPVAVPAAAPAAV